jgi:peptidoglycan/LPS O-acetylase OafA/YrhL
MRKNNVFLSTPADLLHVTKNKKIQSNNPEYFPQIDFVKGLAIISVLLIHSLSPALLLAIYSDLTISLAVPIFFIIMGITTVISFKKEQISSLFQMYSKDYFLKKIKRYFIPFAFIVIFAVIYINILNVIASVPPLFSFDFVFLPLYGVIPPFGAAGDYFISVLFQFILIAPVMYWIFKRSPALLVVLCFSLDLIFEILAFYLIPTGGTCLEGNFLLADLFYRRLILRYLAILSLGFYIANEFIENRHVDLFSRRNLFMAILAPFSVVYLLYIHGISLPFLRPEFQVGNMFTAFYTAVIVITLLNYYPIIAKSLKKMFKAQFLFLYIGKASYHIFLVQALFYTLFRPTLDHYHILTYSGVFRTGELILIPMVLGLLFYYITDQRKFP